MQGTVGYSPPSAASSFTEGWWRPSSPAGHPDILQIIQRHRGGI